MSQTSLGSRPAGVRGFTLVELVLVIVVLGILGAITAPRLPDVGVFTQQFDVRQVVSSLSRARAHAIASQCHVYVQITEDELTAQVAEACDSDTLDYDTPRDFSALNDSTRLQFITEGLASRRPGVTSPTLPIRLFLTPEGEARLYNGIDLSAVSLVPGDDLVDFSDTSLNGVNATGTLTMQHSSGRSIFIDDTTGYARWQ